MREYAFSICRYLGHGSGALLCYMPAPCRDTAVWIAATLVAILPGKISSLVYVVSYDMAKRMYRRTKPAVMRKRFQNGFVMNLDVTQKTQRILYLQKTYESDVAGYLAAHLSPGDTCVDIGANVGYFTLLSAKLVGESGGVIAFEPEADNFQALEQNVALNGFRNVASYQYAIGAKKGTVTLHLNPLNEGGHSIREFERYHDDAETWSQEAIRERFAGKLLEQAVEVVTLDGFLARESITQTPRIIKLDIEGAELDALRGMTKLLAHPDAPDIIAEVSKDGNKILDLLERHGYHPFSLDLHGAPTPYKRRGTIKEKALLFSKKDL